MKKNVVGRISCVLLLMFSLAGCGFHLRGTDLVPPKMQTLYLQTFNPYKPFPRMLRSYLQDLNVHLVNAPSEAPVTLEIVNDIFTKQLGSISSDTLVRTYTLLYTVTFQLKDSKGQVVYGPEQVSTSTTYATSDNQLLGDAQTLEQDKDTMRRELIFSMFNMINSLDGKAGLARIR